MSLVLGRRSQSDSFELLDPTHLRTATEFDILWIDLDDEESGVTRELLARLGLTETASALVSGDTLPMVQETADSILLVASAPEAGELGRLSVDRIGIAVTDRAILTEHDSPVAVIEGLQDPELLDSLDIDSPISFAALLTRLATRQIVPLVEELGGRIDGLDDLAFDADPRTLAEIHVLRRELITLRRLGVRQREVTLQVAESSHPLVGPAGRAAFAQNARVADRIVDALDTTRSLLGSALETYRGAVADETNDIVRLLTVFSAILLPLALITGIFGMNFVSIPTGGETWGFWLWIGVMAVTAVGLWTFFVRRGFIGGESLRDLPKSVGLGLVQVGTAPVRAIASGVESTIHHLDPRRRGGGEEDPG